VPGNEAVRREEIAWWDHLGKTRSHIITPPLRFIRVSCHANETRKGCGTHWGFGNDARCTHNSLTEHRSARMHREICQSTCLLDANGSVAESARLPSSLYSIAMNSRPVSLQSWTSRSAPTARK
jgi:hypothetical protein